MKEDSERRVGGVEIFWRGVIGVGGRGSREGTGGVLERIS